MKERKGDSERDEAKHRGKREKRKEEKVVID